MREYGQFLKATQAKEYSAALNLPLLFDQNSAPDPDVFHSYALRIDEFEHSENPIQRKFCRNLDFPDTSVPYSLYAFKSGNNAFRYFISPRYNREFESNQVGKGGHGIVIPAYELKKIEKKWMLNSTDKPTLAIKIIWKKLKKGEFIDKLKRIQNELEIAHFIYEGTDLEFFLTPTVYLKEKEALELNKDGQTELLNHYFRLYTGMSFISGITVKTFTDSLTQLFSDLNKGEASTLEKEQVYLLVFLKSLYYIRLILREMQNIHKKGILYRDVKCDNIILQEDGVRFIDFGLAATPAMLENRKGRVGTFFYQAPEVYEKKAIYTSQTDIYALGIILMQMLNSREINLYQAIEMFHRPGQPLTRTERGRQLSQLGPKRVPVRLLSALPLHDQVTDPLRESIKKMLAVKPEERPELDILFPILDQAEQTAKNVLIKVCNDRLLHYYETKSPKNQYEIQHLKKEARKIDRINFILSEIERWDLKKALPQQTEIIEKTCVILGLETTKDPLFNLSKIQEKAKSLQQQSRIITPWQFWRILAEYEKTKNNRFFGLCWLFQSMESARAIRAASAALSPEDRYEILVTNYLEKKPKPFLFFGNPKLNSQRTLGKIIQQAGLGAPAA